MAESGTAILKGLMSGTIVGAASDSKMPGSMALAMTPDADLVCTSVLQERRVKCSVAPSCGVIHDARRGAAARL